MRILLFLVLSLCAATACAQRALTTIAVKYTAPEQLVAVIKPYLSEGSSVSAYHNQLILNATPEELAKTQQLLQQLDQAGRQLLVSVRTDGTGSASASALDIDTVIKSGDTVITNKDRVGHTTESRTTVRIQNRQGTSTSGGNQSVRATEGMPAYISTGMAAPVQSYTIGPDGRRYYQQDYLEAAAGFYATTWVNGNTVRVSIDQGNDRLQGRSIATQQLRTEVSGALGEWLPIGTVGGTARQQSSGIGSLGQSSQAQSTQLYLKVEALD